MLYEAQYNNVTEEMDQHGTTVASIIGAASNNNQCGTGIAPAVTISSCVVVGNNADPTSFDGTILAYKFENFDISLNAYGDIHCPRSRRISSPGEFRQTQACPFTHFPGETIIGGSRYNFMHPCEACDFPSETLSTTCDRAIRRHCLYHFLYDREVCLDLIAGLTQGGSSHLVVVHIEFANVVDPTTVRSQGRWDGPRKLVAAEVEILKTPQIDNLVANGTTESILIKENLPQGQNIVELFR
mmetsp:Transcript_24767/g.60852  ORF Transcript_24767/g.60852 Transcript_24767/m.60852 type:complete len:242 (+) Transcript_24767:311-1036(+)